MAAIPTTPPPPPPPPTLLREVTIDGKTHRMHDAFQLIDPFTAPHIDYHPSDYHYPLWNTVDEPDDHAHVYNHTVGEAIAILIEPPPIKPPHGPVQKMRAWKHAHHKRLRHDTEMNKPSSEMALIFDGIYDKTALVTTMVGHRHRPMRAADAAARWLKPIEHEITTQLILPPDWESVVRICATRMLHHDYGTPSSSPAAAPAPPAVASSSSVALVLPIALRLIVADYCVPLVHIGRYYEKHRFDWKSCFVAYHRAMVYDYHPFATFKTGFALMWGMSATPVRWIRARDVYRFGVALGSDQSISQLGAAYSCGYGTKEDQHTAIELLKQSRDPFSYCSYGYRLTESGDKRHNLPQNIPLGIALMTATMCVAIPRLAQKDARTLAQMANWLDFGLDKFLEKDEKKALEYYLAAGDYGDTQCLFYAAISHQNGQGCVKDDVASLRLYRRAAIQQNPEAQCGLAQRILQDTTHRREVINANHALQDDDERERLIAVLQPLEYEAMTLMRHAAEAGLTTALYAIAYWYAFGYRATIRTHPPVPVSATNSTASTSSSHDDADDEDTKTATINDDELNCVRHLPPLPCGEIAEYEYRRSRAKAMIYAQRAIDMGDDDAVALLAEIKNQTDDDDRQPIVPHAHARVRRGTEDSDDSDDDDNVFEDDDNEDGGEGDEGDEEEGDQ